MSAMELPDERHLSNDRLVYTLFFATLFHGLVILGISFDVRRSAASDTPSLEVVIVTDSPPELPDEDAHFLARQAKRGAGEEKGPGRPAAEPSNAQPLDHQGDALSPFPEQTMPGAQEQDEEFVVTPAPSEQHRLALVDASPLPHQTRMDARLMVARPASEVMIDAPHQALPASDDSREHRVAVDTREVLFADYLESWRRKIEQVGTLHYPDAARRQGMAGSPVLEVAVGADGGLREIRIVQASPHAQLDQAAMRILRLAAPFDPFPAELHQHYDSLRFVYEWQFINGRPHGVRAVHYALEDSE